MMNSMYALVSNAVIVLFAMTLQFINSDSKLSLSKSSVTKTANEMNECNDFTSFVCAESRLKNVGPF